MASPFAMNSPQFRRLNPQLGGITPQRAYAESIPQQAGDYDEIMQGYRGMMEGGNDPYSSVISRYQSELGAPGSNQYQPVSYTEAPEFAGAYAKAQEYANTGGLSEAEQGSLRARAISPIRSVYANMQRNMDRNRTLSGGGANYNAVASRMAREGSESIAGATTNANAAIAEMVQKGRLAMTPEMAKLASGKNELMNQVALQNAANQAKYQDNRGNLLSGMTSAINAQQDRRGDALRGMTSLYGTTPALVDTYGRQTQNQQQINNQRSNDYARNRAQRNSWAMR